MALITASTMVLSSLRMIGEKSPGGTLTSAEQTDYLYDLNAAMESWGLDRSMCYQLIEESFALTAGTGSYTIGPGGAFNTARPNEIIDPCFLMDSSNNRIPLEITGPDRFARLPSEVAGNSTPGYLFYDHGFVASRGTIKLHPYPSASLTLYINSWKQLQNFELITTPLSLPPGYQLAIESNFAVMKAGGFTKASPELVQTARVSMARIKSLNRTDTLMQCYTAYAGGAAFDIRTG